MPGQANDSAARDGELFVSLIAGYHYLAMQQMGKLADPMTGKVERDLAAARVTVDTLAMLESKTRGNLDEKEAALLQRLLMECRMNFVDEVRADEPRGEEPEVGAGAEAEAESEAPPQEEAQGAAAEEETQAPEADEESQAAAPEKNAKPKSRTRAKKKGASSRRKSTQ